MPDPQASLALKDLKRRGLTHTCSPLPTISHVCFLSTRENDALLHNAGPNITSLGNVTALSRHQS